MRAAIFTTSLIVVLAACMNHQPGTSTTPEKQEAKLPAHTTASASTSSKTDSLLIENRTLHSFSDSGLKDEFYICIKGSSFTKGTCSLRITAADGRQLLYEEFPSFALMDYGYSGDTTRIQREQYMTTRIKQFFEDKHFHSPAIPANEKYDPDRYDKQIWDEIRENKQSVGFVFNIFEENTRGFVYSQKRKQAVKYYSCC